MHANRRLFLKSTGALAASIGLASSGPLARAAGLAGAARPRTKRRRTLVVVFLRGGADGLNLVVPHGDTNYYSLRRGVAVQPPGQPGGALDLDGFFGLHPAAAPLMPAFRQGSAVALHAVGYPGNTRSHFAEQDTWETGLAGNTIHSHGWLNRHLASSEGHGPIRAVAVGDTLPRILRGDAKALALRGLSELSFTEDPRGLASVSEALARAYDSKDGGSAGELLAQSGKETLEALALLQDVADRPYRSDVAYPETDLAQRLREVARLIHADVGLEVAEVDFGGWDTHQNQPFAFNNLVTELAGALAALHADLGDRAEEVLILTLSEFGRTAAENGTRGTDHGWGNCLLALGGPVLRAGEGRARFVLGDWPGLARHQLNQGRDLAHTTDFRDVIGEAVKTHLGNPNLEAVLPGHAAGVVGLV